MRLIRTIISALSFSAVFAAENASENSQKATGLMNKILTKKATNSDLNELAHTFGDAPLLEGCKIMNLHNKMCRLSIVQFLCKSGAVVSKDFIEAAGTGLEDLEVLKFLCSHASDQIVVESSLSILKGILTGNIFDNDVSSTKIEIAKLCCTNLKDRRVKLPVEYLKGAVTKANIELLRVILDCGVVVVSPNAISTAFLNEPRALEIVMMLVEAGGDPNSLASAGVPIAFEFVMHYPLFSLQDLQILIEGGLDLGTLDNRGLTLLDVAIWTGRFDVANWLDKLGAPTTITDPDEIIDDDHRFNWEYFQFLRRNVHIMAGAQQDGNIWNEQNKDVVNLIRRTLFDVLVSEED